MRLLTTTTLLLSLIGFAGCSLQNSLKSDANPKPPLHSVYIRVDSAWVRDSTLCLSIFYGGCGDRLADFHLTEVGVSYEGEPPVIGLELLDTSNDEVQCSKANFDVMEFRLPDYKIPKGVFLVVGGKMVPYGI